MSELDRLRRTYFEECEELLTTLQECLAALDGDATDSKAVAAAFRVAHSIKGGAGAFGCEGLVLCAHALEAVLDAVRAGGLSVTAEVSAALFAGGDLLADLVHAGRDGLSGTPEREQQVLGQLRALVGKDKEAPEPVAKVAQDVDFPVIAAFAPPPVPPVAAAPLPAASAVVDFPVIAAFAPPPAPSATTAVASPVASPVVSSGGIGREPGWTVHFAPSAQAVRMGNEPLHILRSLKALGPQTVQCDTSDVPPLSQLKATDCYLSWSLTLHGQHRAEDIAEAFAFVAPLCPPTITNERGEAYHFAPSSIPLPPPEGADLLGSEVQGDEARRDEGQRDEGHGDVAHGDVVETAAPSPSSASAPSAELSSPRSDRERPEKESSKDDPTAPNSATSQAALLTQALGTVAPATTIRVDVDRVERLMNMVGELVITQAMLAQQALALPQERFPMLFQGLEDLAHHTREIQESVMAIRAQPVKTVFARLPRLVRETALATGKRVRLRLHGEETEVDKSVVEGLADPLIHLIRNAIDHGIEPPHQRLANGKSEEGTVAVSAEHRSGRIVIQVADDGGGLNRHVMLRKAIEKGLLPPQAGTADYPLGDDEIDELIFHPGFSTADLVSNISGRGVGMDVVRSNVTALGGRIQVRSQAGRGTVFALTLPLTLAVMDGMMLQVGEETYVLPIANIVESVRPTREMVHHLVGRGRMLLLRGQYFPLISLTEVFGCVGGETEPTKALVVLAEGEDGVRVALMVDQLVGLQQVVIKSLEKNYGRLEGISAATILGDGRVALILDVARLRVMSARRVAS